MRIIAFVSAATVLALLSAPAAAQTLTEKNLSAAQAMSILQAAMRLGPRATVAIVDRSGRSKALMAADGSAPHNAELARRKAYTARTFRITTIQFRDRSLDGMEQAGQRLLEDVIPLGGGVPIMIGMEAIGGVGVSGAPGGQPADEACARNSIAAIAATLN
jgi:uncharacterized protein GlcG (DUF336 family)